MDRLQFRGSVDRERDSRIAPSQPAWIHRPHRLKTLSEIRVSYLSCHLCRLRGGFRTPTRSFNREQKVSVGQVHGSFPTFRASCMKVEEQDRNSESEANGSSARRTRVRYEPPRVERGRKLADVTAAQASGAPAPAPVA
jgi:hypothetical protein